MPELIFFRRGDEVLRFGLDKKRRVVLGRGDRCDVVIPDPEVSRTQVALVVDGDQCTAEDLSGKGTLVAGERRESWSLEDGADIALGQWRAIFRKRSSAEPMQEQMTAVDGTRTESQPKDTQGAPRWQAAQVRLKQGAEEAVQPLTGESFSVGKDTDNDVVLKDKFISSKHLRIQRKEGLFHVLDRGSTNGTFLGPVRIYEVEVPLGTTLRMGETELTFEGLSSAKKDNSYEGIIGTDPSVKQLAELIDRVAPSAAPVAILGESGTGKELVAHAIHAKSSRAAKAFIPVNCAAISKELIESELFGHEKGAFTGAASARSGAFEEADGGTLFLDEIGELPLDLQAKLLRALESGEIKRVGASRPSHVDVRIVAATNRDLLQAARAGKFREDLYYRLCVVPVHLSPLRNRRRDIVLLAEHFIRQFAPRGQAVKLSAAAQDRLCTHGWPGNVRELRNVIHRALLLRKGPMIDAADLSFDQEVNPDVGISVPELPAGMTLEQMLEKLERQIIETSLKKYNNNRERVAKELGVARSTLFKRLKDWGLTKGDEAE